MVAARRNNPGLRPLRTLFNLGVIGDATDGQLLERFAAGGEAGELAFAALLERYGPLVLHTCRSILRDEHEAEDAFQATFLVLIRKARSLWVRDSLGPWLHQVACRAARCARSAASRRAAHERRAAEAALVPLDRPAAEDGEERAAAVHEEVDRMPDRYRAPLVLCDLEGRTHEQAARHLGCAVGTVKSRLARGRRRLADRLARRGLGPAAAPAAGPRTPDGRMAPSAALAGATTRAAMRIAAGRPPAEAVSAAVCVLMKCASEGMSMSVLKGTMLAVAAIGACAGGLAWAGLRERAGDPSGSPPASSSRSDPGEQGTRPGESGTGVPADIRGRWEVLYLTGTAGGKREGYPLPGLIVPVTDKLINLPALTGNPRDPMNYLGEMRYALDPGMKSEAIDMKAGSGGGRTLRGIYRLKGDILTICYRGPDGGRPETFAGDGPSDGLIVLRRLPPDPAPRPRSDAAPLPPTGPSQPR